MFSLFLVACGSGGSSDPSPPPQPIVSKIDVAPSSVTLQVGKNQRFVATALDASGNRVDGVNFTWSVDPPNAADVSPDGTVTAREPGPASVIAALGDIRGNATLQIVSQPPPPATIASIDLVSPPPSVFVGDRTPFTAQAKDASGKGITGVTFSWTSSHPEVLSIDNTGITTALQVGSSQITATAEGISSAPFTVTVTEHPKAPVLISNSPSGKTSVSATVKPQIIFDQPIDPSTLPSGWSIQSGNQTVAGQINCDTPCKTATFTPSAPLPDGKYTAIITSNIRSAQGISFIGSFSWSFTVSSLPPSPGWQRFAANGDLFGIHFVSASEGWTVGIDQTILHSTDSGVTWPVQNNLVFLGSPSPAEALIDFYDVFFIDAKTGWAVGWPEAIFKTTDGGATWVEQHLNREPWTDRSGPNGTPDGKFDRYDWCEVWDAANQLCSKKFGVYLRKVQFIDSQHGWTVGRFGYIFKTNDGGNSWPAIPQTSDVSPLPAPCVYPPGSPNAGQPRPEVTSYEPHFFTVDVITPDEVWIGGGSEGDEPCATGWLRTIGHTTDGGRHWQFLYEAEHGGQLEGNGRIFDLKFSRNPDGSRGDIGWAVGGNASTHSNVLQTTDGGQTWHQARGASYPNYTNGFYGLAFIAPSKIWAAGWGGLILHSDDGGNTWDHQQAKTLSQLRHIFFLDENTGWIASQYQIFRTTTGGH